MSATAETETELAFEAIIQVDALSAFVDRLTTLVAEVRLHLDDDGLQASVVDPANVAMAHVSLDAGAFESYHADGHTVGIDLETFDDALGMADSGDLINLKLDTETNKLTLDVDGLEFTLALIDPDSIRQEPDIPDLDLAGEVVLEGREISRAIKAADLCSDHISIGFDVESEVLVFDAQGDTDDVRVELEREDLIDGRCEESVNSLFSLDYLKDIGKPIGKNDELTLEFGDEFPMKLHHAFADGDGSCTNLVAPRIQSD